MSTALPRLVYGSAWKGTATAQLVEEALSYGFIAIDTASERGNYREDLTGEAMRTFLRKSGKSRSAVYIQTKFTPYEGVPLGELPYDTSLDLKQQVLASVESSLFNFRTEDLPTSRGLDDCYLDCLVLHFPLQTAAATFEVWNAMESLVPKKVRSLGISNVAPQVLRRIVDRASVKPAVVQNRFWAANGYDAEVRNYCVENGIVYQAYGVLTKSPELLSLSQVQGLAKEADVGDAAALLVLVMRLDNTAVLTGTCSHMESDLRDMEKADAWIKALRNESDWLQIFEGFRKYLAAAL